jgi:hypothetical protein
MCLIVRNQAIAWKTCHTGISTHGDELWRTQEFSATIFPNIMPAEALDSKQKSLGSDAEGNEDLRAETKFKI